MDGVTTPGEHARRTEDGHQDQRPVRVGQAPPVEHLEQRHDGDLAGDQQADQDHEEQRVRAAEPDARERVPGE